jgi:hypothetical protein
MAEELPPVSELLRIQLRTLYRFDTLGRLKVPAPRLVVTSGHGERLVRTREDIAEHVSLRWISCEDDSQLRGMVAGHGEISREHRGPAYVLPATGTTDETVVAIRGGVTLHPELIARGWQPSERPPYVGVVRDGVVVSVCFSAAECERAAEAGVETATEYRGRGLVLEAVRAWAATVQASGRLALYSTTWDNEASRRVAAKLGAFEYGEDWHLT